ncbi:hypothetical protein K2173_004644 [Erythroxylum novogranatense]|uniref:Uncharacterized protein n=1 Tax=Erythroxylum novogranatense TaxID=1862640 RepID=A0AAV8SXL0_9ROSI|nr:hypothetical protein K2173_004644 [Erythroxylum novogranatense]
MMGSGEDGQLGIGKKRRERTEWTLLALAAIGGWHCLAVDDEGRAYAWGICGNEYGQCVEEPERKDDIGRPLRRDIVIPQHCAPKLVVRQANYSVGFQFTDTVAYLLTLDSFTCNLSNC